MGVLDNISNVAFSTYALPDKLMPEKFTGSFTLTATSSSGIPHVSTKTISNPYDADVVPFFLYTIDGTNWYDGGQNIQTSPSTTASATAYTTATDIVIVAANYTTSSYTLQYKLGLFYDD